MTIVTLYVDDLMLAASNVDLINEFKAAIKGQYKMKDLGELRWILGMEVRRDRKNRTTEIIQTSYIRQMLDRFGMSDCNPVATPADPNVHLTRLDPSKNKPDEWYRSLVGALLYAAMVTRPDIAYAVQVLGRHLQASGEEHRTAAKRVLRYLKGTMDQGIIYGRRADGNILLLGYSDADWAGDRATRRSTTGYVFVLGGGAICWASKLQPTVALSTAEAEYMAVCSASQEALFQRQLLSDLDFPQQGPTTIYEDNTGAIALAENPVLHQRTKHIDIRYHFVRQHVELGNVALVHVASEDQLADLLTKPLPKPKVEHFRERMLGYKG